MAYGVKGALTELASKRDMTTIRGVDAKERIFYVSPYWLEELLIRNTGTNDVQVRLSDREQPVTIPAGGEIDLSGEIAYFLAKAGRTQNIELLYRPSRKLIARRVPPVALYFDGVDDYVLISKKGIDTLDYLMVTAGLVRYDEHRRVTLLGNSGSGNSFYAIFLGNIDVGWQAGRILVYRGDTGPLCVSESQMGAYQFDMISTGTDDINQKVYFYVDGSLDSVHSYGVGMEKPRVSGNIYIGFNSLTREYYYGWISTLIIHSRLLNDREVKLVHNDPLDPAQKGLVLYLSPYSVDIVNSKWYDLSGKGNHGTIYGAFLKELWRPEQ